MLNKYLYLIHHAFSTLVSIYASCANLHTMELHRPMHVRYPRTFSQLSGVIGQSLNPREKQSHICKPQVLEWTLAITVKTYIDYYSSYLLSGLFILTLDLKYQDNANFKGKST